MGNNIALDLDVEHSNNFLKQGIKNLGPNLSERAVRKVCNPEDAARTILRKVDQGISHATGASSHSSRSTDAGMAELVGKCTIYNIFHFRVKEVHASTNG